QLVRSVQAEHACSGGSQPADQQLGLERLDQEICAHSRNDQIGENHKNPANANKAGHDKSEEDVKQEIPPAHGNAFLKGAVRFKRNHQEFLAKQQVDGPDNSVEGERAKHLARLNEQDVSHQCSLQF